MILKRTRLERIAILSVRGGKEKSTDLESFNTRMISRVRGTTRITEAVEFIRDDDWSLSALKI